MAVDPDGDLPHNCWQASHVIPSGSVGWQGRQPQRGGGQYCDGATMPGSSEVTPSALVAPGGDPEIWSTDLSEGSTPLVPRVRPGQGRLLAHLPCSPSQKCQPPPPVRTSGPELARPWAAASWRMARSPAGPSTSRTSKRWPVARPMLAWGWRVHQARTRARLVGGVLDPVGDQPAQGVLANLAAARIPTRAARPPQGSAGVVSATGWRAPAVGKRKVQGQDGDAAGGIAKGGVAQPPAGPAHGLCSWASDRRRCRKLAALLRPQPAASAKVRAVQGRPSGRGCA